MAPEGNTEKDDFMNDSKRDERTLCGDEEDDEDDEDQFEDSFDKYPEEAEKTSPQDEGLLNEAEKPESPLIVKSILPSFVQTGLQRKAPFTEMKYWIALSLTLDGRDKITKVLQYSSRLLAWWFLSKAKNSTSCRGQAERFTNFYKSLGKSRKAFRLGRSINEMQKISSLGLFGLFCWHLKQQHLEDSSKTQEKEENEIDNSNTKELNASSSSNSSLSTFSSDPSVIYNRILSSLKSSFGAVFPSNDESRVQWWKVIGTSLKTIGMLGYFLGDNANFLTSSGALDNYSVPEKVRLARRKRWLDITGKKANQFYFFATIVGLATNSYAYYRFQLKNAIQQAGQRDDCKSESTTKTQDSKETEEKQFVLFLALLKSCTDIVVFSNNPGVDLHKKWRGRKNHEAIHCLCGLISAGTSLYSNFPDAKIT